MENEDRSETLRLHKSSFFRALSPHRNILAMPTVRSPCHRHRPMGHTGLELCRPSSKPSGNRFSRSSDPIAEGLATFDLDLPVDGWLVLQRDPDNMGASFGHGLLHTLIQPPMTF